MERTCAKCGGPIPPQNGRHQPRKFCTECRPPRKRPNSRVVELPQPDVPSEPPLVASYRRQLQAVDRLDTPEGAHVMHLVGLFSAEAHTASGAAALSRELRAAMEAAMRDVPQEMTFLDELRLRRERKLGG